MVTKKAMSNDYLQAKMINYAIDSTIQDAEESVKWMKQPMAEMDANFEKEIRSNFQ